MKDTGGQALKKVTVNVLLTSSEPPVHSISATATTDGNGALLIEHIPSGTYRGEIAANGFEDYFMDNLTVKPEGITTIPMTLQVAQQVEYGLTAPEIDFNKHRVAAVIIEGTGVGTTKIRRITYNPSNKRTLVRLKQNSNGYPRLQVWGCSADFGILPHAPGEVSFR